MRLILYSKPGCHLCEGLQEKLEQIHLIELEVRDITTRDDWFQAYQYEIPVLFLERNDSRSGHEAASSLILHPSSFISLPRPSPRASVQQLKQMLQPYLQIDRTQ